MVSSSFKYALSCGAALILFNAQVMAQTAVQAATGSDTELQTVIVTATRRSESLQNVAGQVTALTGNTLDQMNAQDFTDFAGFVPGLSYASTGASTNLIVIRGITTGSQLSSAIGLYMDDVPLGASTSFGVGYQSLNINTFDLNRVEVLNGPQGTLYGATSLGGTVKYITASPDPKTFSAEAGVGVSSTEHGGINHTYNGMVNLPFGNGIGAVRVDGYQDYDSGYAKDPIFHRDNQGWSRSEGGRFALLMQPTDELDIRLNASTQHIPSESVDVAFRNPVTHQPTYGTYDQAYPTFQPSDYSLTLYSGEVSYDFPFAKLTSISGYQINNGTSNSDQSLTYQAALGVRPGAVRREPVMEVRPDERDQLQHARNAGEQNGVGYSQRREHDGVSHECCHGEQHQGADVLGDQHMQVGQDLRSRVGGIVQRETNRVRDHP